MKKFISNIKHRFAVRHEENGEGGFSLLELVVAVGILLVLSVVGFIAYQGITDNARNATLESAASQLYTAATSAEASGADVEAVGESYNHDDLEATTSLVDGEVHVEVVAEDWDKTITIDSTGTTKDY